MSRVKSLERNIRMVLLTGQYRQTEKFAISHALLVEKHACLRVNLLHSRLCLKGLQLAAFPQKTLFRKLSRHDRKGVGELDDSHEFDFARNYVSPAW